jgi:hypothetical protein
MLETTPSGNPAFKIVYTATIVGDPLKLTQVLVVKNRKEYIITYQAAPTNYEKYASTAVRQNPRNATPPAPSRLGSFFIASEPIC